MHARTRSLAILASALGAATFVLALSTNLSNGALDPSPVATDAAGTARRLSATPVAEVVSLPSSEDTAAGGPSSVIERTEVAADLSALSAPFGDEERVRLRATALAQKLGLAADGEATLTAVLLEEQTRRAGALAALRRTPEDADARARVRGELDAILVWKTKVLNDRFGAEHAAEIMKRR